MALAPKFAGQALAAGVPSQAQHTLELYLDPQSVPLTTDSFLRRELTAFLAVPIQFSAKLFNTFYESVAPLIASTYANKLRVIFRQHVQPWHPSSTLVHEAAVGVLKLAPEKFWEFSHVLFKEQQTYFDVNVVNETRNQTYKRLAALGAKVGVDEEALYKLLEIPSQPGPDGSLNSGNQVTNDFKLLIKANRVVGVHVSPTVFFNGIEEKSISSSFTADQWKEWLEKNVV